MGQRIGGGFEKPDRQQSKMYLRNRFLEAVSKHARHVLIDLSGEPFGLYKEAHKPSRHSWDGPEWQRNYENRSLAYNPRKESFRQSLFEWSRRNHLDAVWCRERAYETLNDWSYDLPDDENLCFQPLIKLHKLFDTGHKVERFVFECDLLHPQLKPLEDIEEEILEKFNGQLKAFLQQYDTRAREQGYIPTPEIYKSKYRKYYYRWLVEWAMNGKPIKTIAEESKDPNDKGLRSDKGGPDNKTVRDAVTQLAGDIELPLASA